MSVVEAAIGCLAPPICVVCSDEGLVLCEGCRQAEIKPYGSRCWRCGSLSDRAKTCANCLPASPRYVWISTDYDGAARDVILAYKFKHLRTASAVLAQMMRETFLTYNSDEDIAKSGYLVVPVPTATSRIRERSFGHAELLALNFSRISRLEYSSALGRLGQSKQRGARREARLKQASNQYYVKNNKKIAKRNILLIDDVLTTGGTIKAAYKTLRAAGAGRVDALVFAKKL